MHADGPSPSKRVSSPKPADKSLPPRTAPGVLEPPPHTPPPLPPLYHPVTLLRLIRRIFVLSTLFAPLLLTFPIWWFFNKGRKPHQLKTWWIRYLAWTLEQSGGLFVKLGQWLSSRGDVVPNEVCTVLARLQSDVRPHSARDSRKAIERMYGVEALEEVFEEFDVVPVGVGAVAQVHRAVLKPHFPDLRGEEVAIKVLHPGIRHRVKTDLVLVELFARFVSLLPGTSHLAIRDEVATFARMMRDQLDLRVEAWNLQVFRKNFLGVEDVAFPKPISCGRDVLVETFHRGLLLRDVLDNGPTGFDGAIADAGIKAFMKMILRDNFFHSDLHPGNILLTFTYTPESATLAQQAGAWVSTQIDPTPSTRQATQAPFRPKVVDDATLDNLKRAPKDAWGPILERLRNEGFRPRLIVLDAGLVGSLKKENLENTKAAFLAALDFDGTQIAQLFLTRSKDPSLVIDPEGAKRNLAAIMDDLKLDTGGKLPLSRIRTAEIIPRVATLLREHRIRLDGEFSSLFVCCVLVEGVGRRLQGEMDLVPHLVSELAT